MKQAHARTRRPRGLGDRPRLHGHVGLLRRAPTKREALRTIERALDLGCNFLDTSDMYGPHTNERLVGRAIADRREEVFLATKFGIKIEPGDPPRRSIDGSPDVRARSLRGLARAPRRRPHRPLLPAPRRPQHADRGDGRRDGRARRGGQGAPPRPLGGERRDDPPRARGAPDHRGAERVLAVDARRRGGDPADARGAGDRPRPLLAARPRLPLGPLHLARRARRGRLPPLRPALHRREPRAEPARSPSASRSWRPRRGSRRASSRSRGCCTAASTSCRSPAPSACPTWRRTSPPPTSS